MGQGSAQKLGMPEKWPCPFLPKRRFWPDGFPANLSPDAMKTALWSRR